MTMNYPKNDMLITALVYAKERNKTVILHNPSSQARKYLRNTIKEVQS